MDPEIKKLQRKYDQTSRIYDLLDWVLEYSRYRECRREVWTHTQGTILDAGIGTGRNIDFYPPDADVTGIDLSAGMLRKAEKRARQKSMSIRLHHMDVLKMSFPNNHFDVIVATFLCCVIPNSLQVTALREMRRVCKRDGEIILLEYAFSKNPLRRLWMKILTPYVHWVYGASFDRHTSDYVREERFHVLEERFLVHDVVKLIRMKP